MSPEEIATVDELSASAEAKALWARLFLFGILLAGIVIDLLFLVGWVYAIKGADYVFERIIKPEGIGKVIRVAVEAMFDASTLTVVAVYVVRDLKRVVVRLWKQP